MEKEIKAALLSAFVCPGVGQMFLGRYLKGLAMMIVVVGGAGFTMVTAALRALEELEKIQRAGNADVVALASLAASSSARGASYDTLIWIAIACCWTFSVIDAYRTGKAMGGKDAGDEKG